MEAQTQERNYIQRAFGRRVTIARIPWNVFVLEFLATLVCCQYGSWVYGPLVGIALWAVTFALFKLDPHPVRAFLLWRRYGRHAYDSGSRFYFKRQEEKPWSQYAITVKRFYARVTSQS